MRGHPGWRGGDWQQGSVYFDNEAFTTVACVGTTQKLAKGNILVRTWLEPAECNICLLRIEENNHSAEVMANGTAEGED